ncbi:chlorhexidine efflux transporter [Vibrio mediterranei]|uniref:chlorhexidine efflux transporter n=1 Tax=Vibrio mediterranei TaxID=689 RepID=UPI001F0BD7DA|nr:chlorhexidine efflux transporter [Vibrio mediterranei]
MNSKNVMRSPADRLRHTILFELLLLLIAAPICMFVFGANVKTAALTAFSLSLIAMVWNYIYNYAFDRALIYLRGTSKKKPHSTCLPRITVRVRVTSRDYSIVGMELKPIINRCRAS